MAKNPGIYVELPDKRRAIVYDKQPLLKEKGKVIINLVDEKMNILKDENQKPKILMKDVHVYNEEAQTWKLIGYVD